MSTKVIRKEPPVPFNIAHPVSTDCIIAPQRFLRAASGNSGYIFSLSAPIRPQVVIKMSSDGTPNIPVDKPISLGNQFEHYSTWIHFDLDDLLWYGVRLKEYVGPDYYSYYDFRVYFKDLVTNEIFNWEFDGHDFKVPKQITKHAGQYELSLSIQERLGDSENGNIKDPNIRETFISKKWLGEVKSSIFNPAILENIQIIDDGNTTQKMSLVKPPVDCFLSDDGFFTLTSSNSELGVRNDSYVSYLRFNPENITTHLQDFNIYAFFKKEDFTALTVFERTDGNADDNTTPYIGWIPDEVLNYAGPWKMLIAAVSKNYKTDNEKDPSYTDQFYRFISDDITVKVIPSFVEDPSLEAEATAEFYDSNFLSQDEEAFIGKENAIFEHKNTEVKA